MGQTTTIARKTVSSDFERLKIAGLELAQQYAGEVWTDYNVHDPGRAILEHLCYALTDLSYKADFNVEDYLCDENGVVDYEKLGLQTPEDILPCRPITLNDYRKILLDSVPELNNVWIAPATENGVSGLYRVTLRLRDGVNGTQQQEVVDKVRQVYCRQRNLCEDIVQIDTAPEVDCELQAHIEVMGNQDIADILARVYFACERLITQEIATRSYVEALDADLGLEELLRGPYLQRGYIADRELIAGKGGVDLLDLLGAVNTIDGIAGVKSLTLRAGERSFSRYLGPHDLGAFPRLQLPENADQILVKLTKDGRELIPSFELFRGKYAAMCFNTTHSGRRAPVSERLAAQPEGEYRNLQQYVSIQNDFPDNFGINARGLPDSASPQEKGRAAQLKGYLLLFDQIMANYGANLQNLRKLYSPDIAEKRSYAVLPLEEKEVPGTASLYRSSPAIALRDICQRYDNYADRKSRLLDYLLAIYGEKFTQTALSQFTAHSAEQVPEDIIIENKNRLLHHIVEVNRDRSGGRDYCQELWSGEPAVGIELKVRLLLGMKQLQNRSLTDSSDTEGFHVVEHLLLRSIGNDCQGSEPVEADFFSHRLSVIFPAWPERFREEKFRHLVEETFALNCPVHIYPEFFWLDLDRMVDFETLYCQWAKEKSSWPEEPVTQNQAAAKLRAFLVEEGGRIRC